jgi:tRNA A37 threonylcarbamoyladenosine biosynthesis protein TsaE
MTASHSVEETEALGYEFAQSLLGSETICVIGEVGSGKSSFVRGMIKYLFPKEEYKPTILKSVCNYQGRMLHIDGSNFLRTGLPEEFLQFQGIRVIEHGNLWREELMFDCKIEITRTNPREVSVWR